jgi:mannose-1-phosphate guanylyltransferase
MAVSGLARGSAPGRHEKVPTGSCWAIVLAAGEGRRLSPLTTDGDGREVPKQFCSIPGESTLLAATLRRAGRVVPRQQIVTIVAEEHREWWEPILGGESADNVLVEPVLRGTAAGVLLPLLTILRRDPEATILLFPSDHGVEAESTLEVAIRQALRSAESSLGRIVLLGMRAEAPDPDLGWIQRGRERSGDVRRVLRFHEKPDLRTAARLYRSHALWNSMILAAKANSLVRLFGLTSPELLASFYLAFERGMGRRQIAELYHWIPSRDFSTTVLEPSAPSLWVLSVPPCGWSDLGTEQRLRRFVLERRNRLAPPPASPLILVPAPAHRGRHLATH